MSFLKVILICCCFYFNLSQEGYTLIIYPLTLNFVPKETGTGKSFKWTLCLWP